MSALAEVLARPDIWRGGFAEAALPAVASGFAALDAELPGGGWPRGALTELLVDGVGLGELSLLTPALRAAGWPLVIGAPCPLHAPAWAAAGIDLARLVIVAPRSEGDALWAMEQALACGPAGAVLCWAARADARAVRRLQLAAAASGALAFLFRPARAAGESSAAVLRLRLAPAPGGRLAVAILKRRGPPRTAPLHLTLPRPAPVDEPALARPRPAPVAARSAAWPARA